MESNNISYTEVNSTKADTKSPDDIEDVYVNIEENEKSNITRPKAGLTLEWNNLSLLTKIKDPKTKKESIKTIINNVSGNALPGELLILMGPSGAGKSSLLDCISGRNPLYDGILTVNGIKWNNNISKLTAYVLQDDLFYETLTVFEHLLFQAELRIGSKNNKNELINIINDTMKQFGLTKTKNTMIGGIHLRGISGGERKRLSLATELLSNPSIFYVDEPTSGLDSYMAEQVVIQLRSLARTGRTVIATLHQPSSELFTLFDKLYLLTEGNTVYHGKADDAVEYFKNIGYQCPSYTNPTDYFMKIISISTISISDISKLSSSKNNQTYFINKWNENKTSYVRYEGTLKTYTNDNQELQKLTSDIKPLSKLRQLNVLVMRGFLRIARDKLALQARVMQNLVLALIMGLIYLRLDISQKGIQNFTGAIFFMSVNQVFSNSMPECFSTPADLLLFKREYNSALYCSLVWYLAKTISEILIPTISPLFFLFPFYFMIGFGGTVITFIQYLIIIVLLAQNAVGIGYFVGCLCNKAELASIIGPLIILPFVLFGGMLLNTDDVPKYFIWLEYISPVKYAYIGWMNAFWINIKTIPCSIHDTLCIQSGEQVLKRSTLTEFGVWECIGILIALSAFFRILAYISLVFNARKKTTMKKVKAP